MSDPGQLQPDPSFNNSIISTLTQSEISSSWISIGWIRIWVGLRRSDPDMGWVTKVKSGYGLGYEGRIRVNSSRIRNPGRKPPINEQAAHDNIPSDVFTGSTIVV